MADGSVKEYEILVRVTKKDCTSLVSLVCSVEGMCCIVPKGEISSHVYSNATIGVNGKVYPKSNLGRPITSDVLSSIRVEGMSKQDFIRFLTKHRYRVNKW